jgi:hypothetical protein
MEGNAGAIHGVVGDAVVADQGIGVDEYLTEKGGVGKGLRVAGHAGREHDFALDSLMGAEGPALELRAVLED